PPTATCMNCHTQIWADTEMLAPVRESYITGEPLQWNRVNDLPDYVYFNHSIHLKKGVGCETCHGPVNEMPLVYQEHTLQMGWCLECHREPEKFVRPREEIFNMNYEPEGSQIALGLQLVEEYDIHGREDCGVCHR
ncbi:MAG: ammonia-forming cytochrome c nitrite reductase subunit c552, partial [Acidobacteriota bacterium]